MGDENKIVEAAVDIWNPGGNPEQIRAAATAWREMAGNLTATATSLRSQANGATSSWTGSASDAFKTHIAKLTDELDEGARGMNEVAGELDHIAGEIQRINDEIHQLYIEIGVTIAAGALLSVVTFGFSGAAAAGAAAVAAARAGTLVARMGFLIVRVIQTIRSIKGAALVFRFAVQFSVGLGAKVFANVATGKSALDLDGDDWIDVAVGGVIGAGAAPLARAPGFSRVISSPALREVAVGSFAGAAGNVGGNIIKGEEITPGSVVTAALIGGTSAGIGYKAGNYAVNRLNRSLFGSPGIGSTPAGYGSPRPAGAPRLWTPADGPIVPGGRGPAVVGAPGVKGMSVSTTPGGLYVARTSRVPTGHPAVRGMGLSESPSGLVVANSKGSTVPAGDPALSTLPTRARPSGLHVIDGYMRNQAGVQVPNKYAHGEAFTPVFKETSAGGAAVGPQGVAGSMWEDNGAFWDQPQRLDQHDDLASSRLGDAADRLSHDWSPQTKPFPPQQPPPPPPDSQPGGGAPPTHVAGGGTHQVAPGDSLWSIAEREYGDGSYARHIARANPHITDPNLVRPGDRLVLPPIPQPATAAP